MQILPLSQTQPLTTSQRYKLTTLTALEIKSRPAYSGRRLSLFQDSDYFFGVARLGETNRRRP